MVHIVTDGEELRCVIMVGERFVVTLVEMNRS